MRRFCLLAFMSLAAVTLPGASAQDANARPKVSTKYTYYTISGSTARKLYQQMISRGPHVSGDRALAATSAETRQSGDFVSGKSCKLKNYKISLKFTMRLPKIRNEAALSRKLRNRWRKFYKFVRHHEERHKQIWIGCARDVERRVKALRTPNCKAADRKANRIFRTIAAACEKKHDAFDRKDQKRLSRHPLIVAAKRVQKRKKTSSRALSRSTSTQKINRRKYIGSRTADDF